MQNARRAGATKVNISNEKDGYINIIVSEGTPPYRFLWSNNEISQNIENLSPGQYILQVLDTNNCIINDTFKVLRTDKNCQGIPEIFTPNGDGKNDTWIIENVDIYPNIEVKIYNRWGTLVFESIGYQTPWDGTYNGKELPADAYYYVIDLKKDHDLLQGVISIIR